LLVTYNGCSYGRETPVCTNRTDETTVGSIEYSDFSAITIPLSNAEAKDEE